MSIKDPPPSCGFDWSGDEDLETKFGRRTRFSFFCSSGCDENDVILKPLTGFIPVKASGFGKLSLKAFRQSDRQTVIA